MSGKSSKSGAIPWAAAGAFYGGLAAVPALDFAGLAIRLALALAALGLAGWTASGRKLDATVGPMYVFLALGLLSVHAIVEGPERLGGLITASLAFLVAAVVLRAHRSDWLALFLPLCSALVLVPAVLKTELSISLSLSAVTLACGQALTWLRAMNEAAAGAAASLRTLNEKVNSMIPIREDEMIKRQFANDRNWTRELQSPLAALQMLAHADDELSPESKRLMDEAILKIRRLAEQAESAQARAAAERASEKARGAEMQIVEAPVSGVDLSKGESQMFRLEDIARMMDAAMAKKRSGLPMNSRVQLSWSRSVERDLPVVIQINADDFSMVVGSLIDQAIESLGGGEGVVRVGLHPGLRQIQVTVEDNGRGMTEELLMRLQARGLGQPPLASSRLSFKQIRALISFWGGRVDRQARLGVGSRVTVEIPRVDAFATPFAQSRECVSVSEAAN